MMKNAYLPNISIFFQFGSEILVLLCRDDSIQILLVLSQFLMFGTAETKLDGFVWSHEGHNRANISPPDADFWQVGICHHALSEYSNKSHNFINLVFVM